MGPCPFRHGYADDAVRPVPCRRGFNGAMPFQAWIQRTVLTRREQIGLLQWGHALSGMDTSYRLTATPFPAEGFNGAMPFQAWIPFHDELTQAAWEWLQWGHALSGMDTCDAALHS